MDDELYESFRENFKDFSVVNINEDELKSAESKEKWRPFLMSYENKVSCCLKLLRAEQSLISTIGLISVLGSTTIQVEDFNYATLLRLNSADGYSENNTTIGK